MRNNEGPVMIGKFKAFLAGKPYNMDESQQETWANLVAGLLPEVLREWYDPNFSDMWTKDGAYYEKARLNLAGLAAFKKHYAEYGDILQALRRLEEFFADEKRKAGLGKTTKKPPKVAQSSGISAVVVKPKAVVLEEGAIKDMHISKRERNPELRRACIEHYMATHDGRIACEACGMAFGEVYGEVGEGYIEVHHLSPISQTEGAHEVDPKADLVPLCANCHAMIHRLMAAEKKLSGAELEGNAALEKLRGVVEGHR